MSPEQVRGKELDTRTDLFSFGVVLYEMATGAPPFPGETSGVIFESILNRAPVPALRLNPGVPPKLEDIINRALEKDRELRYQSARDMRAELQRLKRDTDTGRMAAASSGMMPAAPESSGSHAAATQPGPSSSASRVVAAAPSASRATVAEVPATGGKKPLKILVPAGVVIVAVLIAAALYFRSHSATPLTGKDTVVLADFANTTGDPVFDGTLKQALGVDLEQSPYLQVIPQSRVQQTLGFMGRQPNERLTLWLASCASA
jgi:eukaryotic-like serine/threonine-protein kinase